jgi:3-oxoacyl-[acyl-carrier protein] reductase
MEPLNTSLQDRIVVVTGAGGPLGSRMTERFARQGAAVAAVVRDPSRFSPSATHAAMQVFTADAASETEVIACFDQIKQTFGRADVLIHTVGTWSSKPFLKTSLAEWNAMMDTNLTSTFLCFREALRLMNGRGRLIGIASAQGADQGRAQQAAYSASKAGLVRLVESVAAEWAGTGVTAHAIAPSTILYDDAAGQKGVPAESLADLCVYLCSDAGTALNGKTLRAYGSL